MATECELRDTAEKLYTVADEATKDLEQMHEKVDRKKIVESANEKTLGAFSKSQSKHHSKLENMLDGHIQEQTDLCYETRADIGKFVLFRAHIWI